MELNLSFLRDITLASVAFRLFLTVLCGGLIGMEREYKRRPAGFRTHILICMGASITTMTSEYVVTIMHYFTDIGRLGAQVVAGIGFIGAGCIIVTQRKRIKGLTTAAGLWTTAIIGLSIGAGFYEGGVAATFVILLAELVFAKFEYAIVKSAPEMNVLMEYTDRDCLERVLENFKQHEVKVLNLNITRSEASKKHNASAIFYLRLPKKYQVEELVMDLNKTDGVISAEEI